MQANSQLREPLCWSHTPRGAVWLINSHCPALPRRRSPREPEKSLLQGTKIQTGVQPLGESQSQDEKPGPARCPPQRWGDSGGTGGTGCGHRPAPSVQPGQFPRVQAPSAGTAPGGHHVEASVASLRRARWSPGLPPLTVWSSLYGGLDQNISDAVLCFSRVPPTPRPKHSLGRSPSHHRREASGGTGPPPRLRGERGEEARLISHALPGAGQAPGSSGPSSGPRLQNSGITQAAGRWRGGDRRRQALPESTPRHALPPSRAYRCLTSAHETQDPSLRPCGEGCSRGSLRRLCPSGAMSPTAPGSLGKQEHPRVAFPRLLLLRQATLSLDASGCKRWDRLSLGELLRQPNLTGITPFTRLEQTQIGRASCRERV